MAQQPRVLTPHRSPLDRFGSTLRSYRVRYGLSQAQLAVRVLVSAVTLAKVEKAERWPTEYLARRCDAELDAGGELVRLWTAVLAYRQLVLADLGTLRLPLADRCDPQTQRKVAPGQPVDAYNH